MAREKLEPTNYPGIFRDQVGRIVIRVSGVDPKTGKLREKRRTLKADQTMRDAVRQLVALRAEARGETVRVSTPSLLICSQTWVKRKGARGEWRPGATTKPNVVGILKNHVWPFLGDILLDQLTVADIREWMDAMMEAAQPSTVRARWSTVLAPMLKEMLAEYGLPDLTTGVKTPRAPAKGGADLVLLPEQMQSVLAYTRAVEPDYYALAVLGFASGARVSELAPCKVSDLDLSAEVGRWGIARHLGHKSNLLDGSKTGPGRVAYLDPWSTAELRRLTEKRFAADWLTRGRKTGQHVCRWAVNDYLGRAAKAAGLPGLSSKTFRQTYVTLCQLAGLSLAHAKDQVGHTTDKMLDVYTRTPVELREASARRMEGVLKLGTNSGTRSDD